MRELIKRWLGIIKIMDVLSAQIIAQTKANIEILNFIKEQDKKNRAIAELLEKHRSELDKLKETKIVLQEILNTEGEYN